GLYVPGGGERRREALERPPLVERPALAPLAVDEGEIAARRVHRQPRLDRVVAIVALDQVVDRAEAPVGESAAPASLEPLPVARRRRELPPGGLERTLVRGRLGIDLAQ